MATLREKLLSIVSCSKCGQINENERIYVNKKMLCVQCAGSFKRKTVKRVVKSYIWTTLCTHTKALLTENNVSGQKDIEEKTLTDKIGENEIGSADTPEPPFGNHNQEVSEIESSAVNCNEISKNDLDDVSNEKHCSSSVNIENNLSKSVNLLEIKSNADSSINIDSNAHIHKSVETSNDEHNFLPNVDDDKLDTEIENVSVDCNDILIENALKYFFKHGPGSSIIQQCTDGDTISANDNELNSYESVMQREMECFFNTGKGKLMLKSVVADEVKSVIDQKMAVREQKHDTDTNMVDGNVVSDNPEYESDNDMFVPPTPLNNNKPLISSIMATSISLETREIINKFAQYFNLQMHNNLFSDTDCLISDELLYTQKWLYARCKGIPIVNSIWMNECLNSGQILPTTKYLFQPSFEIPPLFRTLDIILCPPFSELSESEYSKLWNMAGARVSSTNDWLPGPEHLKRLIVFDIVSLDISPEEMKSMIMFHRAPAVTKSYLLTMLTSGTVDCIENHLYDIFQLNVKELKRLGFPCKDDLETE